MINSPHPKKSLGQHFLTCDWALTAIMDAAHLTPADTVLEIGPGTGILTRALATRVKKVVAIEKDEALAQTLARQLKSEKITNIDVHEGDILKNIPPMPASYKVVANIPYYLTARLLRLLLAEQKTKPSCIALMIQKEVAERIIALPPHENILAISVQVFGTPELVAAVPASCFAPRPRVDSAIISLSDISDNFFIKHHITSQAFFRVVRLGFSQKRKMLVNSLSAIMDKPELIQLFLRLSLNEKTRPEELSLVQWAELARNFF